VPRNVPSTSWLLVLVLGGLGVLHDSARAQATARPLIVIVQSGLGDDGGETLRAALSQSFGVDVVAVSQSSAVLPRPRAMLTLAVDERGMLNAIYWDESSAFDVLSAPAPKPGAARQTAALTLASALVQRHLDTLRDEPYAARDLDANDDELIRLQAWSALSQLRRHTVGRLAVALRVEDF
jgi:hypothetical protein